MPRKTTDLLSVFAGLDTAHVTGGQRGTFTYRAISRFFDKAENVLTLVAARHSKP